MYKEQMESLMKGEILQALNNPIYVGTVDSGIGIISDNGLLLITKDLKVKKNGRSIMFNKKTKRSFLGKTKALVDDENYVSNLLSYVITNGRTIKNEELDTEFRDSVEHVLLGTVGFESIEPLLLKTDISERKEFLENNPDFLSKFDTLTLLYNKGSEREKDLDNSTQLVLDSYQKFMEMKKLPFNDKNISYNFGIKNTIKEKGIDTVNLYFLS